jgi:hypothetical protein
MNPFPLLETEPLSPEANHRIFTALAREMTLDAPAIGGGELVEDATISYLQPDEPARRNRRPWLLGLIAVAAAVLGAGIMVRDNSARTRTGTEVTPETMPIYLPTKLPDGLSFVNANDYTIRNTSLFRDQVYRDLSKPIGARAVEITTTPASIWVGMSFGHPILIQGRSAFDESERGLPAVRLTDGQVSIHIGGRGVSYSEIEQIAGSAQAISTNPTDGVSVKFLPDGLKLVLDQATRPPYRNITATYAPPDDNGLHQLNVNIWPASLMNLDQWAVGRSGELTQTTVRGHDAISVAFDGQNGSIVWSETRSVLIEVSGFGVSPDQVRQAAESLRRVGSTEWANLLKSKDIPIQDDGAPGSSQAVAVATTAAGNNDRALDPGNLPLLIPQDVSGLGKLRSATDRTSTPNLDGTLRLSQRLIYRETGSAPGLRAVQVEWSYAKFIATVAAVGPIEGQVPFTEPVPPEMLQSKDIDPNGVFFRVSGRGVTQDELRTVAKAVTAPGTVSGPASWINVGSLPDGFILAESREPAYEQYRSTMLDYGSVSVAMNPAGSGGIESYAVVTPGSFTAAKVRGHDGYSVTDPATNTLRLVWTESPGLLVEVKGIGADVASLQRIADSLQPVSTDAWTKLLGTVGAKPETVKAP